ncbi:MAG: signal peptidase I [Acidobacteriaceae bacterium]
MNKARQRRDSGQLINSDKIKKRLIFPLLPPDSNNAGNENPEGAKPPSTHLTVSSWVRDLLFAVGISFLIITFLYQPVRVEGTSMMPGLRDQERLFINKFQYHFEPIHRDDVVVFHYPLDPSKSYIKRVIALPGDTLRIDDGQVYVNGKALKEPYVPLRFRDDRSYPKTILPPDEYFVMGDHRLISSDSRDFGPVNRKLIYGKATFVYWPTDDMGVVR